MKRTNCTLDQLLDCNSEGIASYYKHASKNANLYSAYHLLHWSHWWRLKRIVLRNCLNCENHTPDLWARQAASSKPWDQQSKTPNGRMCWDDSEVRWAGAWPFRLQESCAIAKMTAQCALHMGALKIFGTHWLRPRHYSQHFYGLLFRLTLWMFLQNLKSVALPVPEIIGGTQKIWAVLDTPTLTFLRKF